MLWSCLDKNLSLPKKLSNLKRSVIKYISKPKNNINKVFDNLYVIKNDEFIERGRGVDLGLTKTVLPELLNHSFESHNFSLTNEIVIELYCYKESNSLYTFNDLKFWLHIFKADVTNMWCYC